MRERLKLPFLTADVPGIGGVLKDSPEDFLVEEIPLYEPSGEGRHVYLWIEKRGLSTFDAVRRLAGALGVEPREVGYAGLKDTKSVSRQYVSVFGVSGDKARSLAWDDLKVLDVRHHVNKLKIGHLAGNRFRVILRGVEPAALERARDIMAVLARRGVPNFYGPQRFGVLGRNAVVGRAILRKRYHRAVQALFAPTRGEEGSSVHKARLAAWCGDYNRGLGFFPQSFVPERCLAIALRKEGLPIWYSPSHERAMVEKRAETPEPAPPDAASAGAPGTETPPAAEEPAERVVRALPPSGKLAWLLRRIPKRFLEFYVSALQSELFNEVVKARFDTLDTVLEGDLAWIHSKGAVFLVADPAAEAPRAATFEISPTGPIYGTKLPKTAGLPAEIERRILESAHLRLDDFRTELGVSSRGVRRPLRIPLGETSVEPVPDGLAIAFTLPKGAYATTVLREVIKPAGLEGLV